MYVYNIYIYIVYSVYIYIYLFTNVYVYIHYIQHYYRTNNANLKIGFPSMRWPIRRSLHLPLNVGHGCELCVRSKFKSFLKRPILDGALQLLCHLP